MVWRAFFGLGLCAAYLVAAQPAASAEQGRSSRAAAAATSLEEALSLPIATGLAGAGKARRFAWVESAAGVRNLWVAEAGKPARRVTAYSEDDGQQIYHLSFSDDGTRLAFVRGGDEDEADADLPNPGAAAQAPKQQLFVVGFSGGEPQLIAEGHSPVFSPAGDRLAFTRRGEIWVKDGDGPPRKLATVRGEVERLQWSPDGARLLFSEDRSQYSFVGLIDVAEARLRYLDPGLGWSVEPVFSPDGRQVAFIRFLDAPAGAARVSGPYWSIRVTDLESGRSRAAWTAPEGPGSRYYESRGRDLFWTRSGDLVFPWERTGWTHFYAVPAAGGGTARELTPGDHEVETLLVSPDGQSITYSSNEGDADRKHIWRRPLRGGSAARLTGGEGIESFPTFGADALAVIATDVSRPAHPALVERRLIPMGKSSPARGFVAPEPVIFRAEDGVQIHAQLFRARGGGKRPGIVYIHGGPRRQMLLGFHPSSYYSNAYVMNQHLAAQGYNVLAVNYRSGTGYGREFREAPDVGREGAAEYRDVLAAGRWLAAQPSVDPSRIGLWGGSWGGYLVALGLARDSDLFAAGVDLHGVHTLLRPVPESLSPEAQQAARQKQWESSPLASIDRWRSPVLLIHGDDDRNVAFSQSLLLARELAARGIKYCDLTLPNERHTFMRYAHWLQSFRATEAFLDEHLMRKAEGK